MQPESLLRTPFTATYARNPVSGLSRKIGVKTPRGDSERTGMKFIPIDVCRNLAQMYRESPEHELWGSVLYLTKR